MNDSSHDSLPCEIQIFRYTRFRGNLILLASLHKSDDLTRLHQLKAEISVLEP